MAKNRGKKKTKHKLFLFDVAPSASKVPSRHELLQQVDYLKCNPSFCFEFYDDKHRTYSAKSITNSKDFHRLIDKLKMFGKMTWGDMERSGNYHAHDVTWHETNETTGFPKRLGETPQRYPAYQFGVFDKFRIFGFHRSGIFHVVWFDRNHSVDD